MEDIVALPRDILIYSILYFW